MNWHFQQKLKRFGAEFDDSGMFVIQGNGYLSDTSNEQVRQLILALEIQYAAKSGHCAPWPE